ncbi:uncharacterized protein [Palaemon carinicauda]|uniref:uncharacterized protein n=1 Tax=Palaemon carinicauda TaxID=392227 RepID=UPI0035B688A0
MLKAKTVLGLFGLALSFSCLMLYVMTFVVLPNDVLQKSSFHRTQGLPLGQRSGGASIRQKMDSLLKSNNAAGRFAQRHVVDIDANGEVPPAVKKSRTSPSFGVEEGHLNKREDKDKKELFPKGGRPSGIRTIPQAKFPLLRVRPEVRMTDDGRVNVTLLLKTLRDHGVNPKRARTLVSTLWGKDERH